MRLPTDIVGTRFERLVVTDFIGRNNHSQQLWRCRCDCGTVTIVVKGCLTTGETRSCGCLMRETNSRLGKARIVHGGMAGGRPTPEFTAWMGAKARCYDSKHVSYPRYGALGITMCDRWRGSFAHFLADMGQRPSTLHSLDRFPDVHGPYAPVNCRWATRAEQTRNKRNNVMLTWRGETKCMADWAVTVGLTKGRLQYRLSRGWSIDRALSTPSRKGLT